MLQFWEELSDRQAAEAVRARIGWKCLLGVDLVGPPRGDLNWQHRGCESYGAGAFEVDWEARCVRCPQGRTSTSWGEYEGYPSSALISLDVAQP